MSRVATCLWFANNGHLAARFYVSLFPNSEVTDSFKHRDGIPLVTHFTLDGAPYQALNGGTGFHLDAAASISVVVQHQEEMDHLRQSLIADGGAAGKGGWLKDKFGLSWQLVPQRWLDIRHSADKDGMRRAFNAILEADRIDIAVMEAAFYGRG